MANNNYIFKDNSKKGEFTHVSSNRMNKYNSDDEMLGAGAAALIIGGLLGAAAVVTAADDYNARRDAANEIRREAEALREAERREAEREAKRRADEIRREAERAARRAVYGMTVDEVTKHIVKFCMEETSCRNKMVVMTAIVRELDAQGAVINSVENSFGDLRMKGRCLDGNELKITLNSVGGITIYAYDAKLARYSTSSKVFKEYEILLKDYNKEKFEKLARVMSY